MMKRVLRHEFSNGMMQAVAAFSETHRYDDRKTYKAAWAEWLTHPQIAELLIAEVARLRDCGYKGDVADKLFKSGRYYFRVKQPKQLAQQPDQQPDQQPAQQPDQTQTQPQKKRERYVMLNRELLNLMDDHIDRGVRSNDAYTPANGFVDFCIAQNAMLQAEIARLSALNNVNNVNEKLKKTYKNRYFSRMKSVAQLK